ncbi:hypothetical protein LRQ04_05825 [Paenarthrobacter sp. AR 02]|uniref:RHS repeat domain-containing protein n=1 Tax=Paenarthrobacter sp. AR 02 TaxID=2899821 RepID=UPI001F384C21|nr:RHS repeat-associated core domain-containing protein [Paenarthrobacter sp. AR 02]MCF3138771.1 hypothetical protein [Paenarthrobacter sp. AR 02]
MTGLRSLFAAFVVSLLAVAGLAAPAMASPVAVPAAPTTVPAAVPALAPAALPTVVTDASQAGVFVPAQGRLVDTRDGSGGVAGPVAANTWTPIQVLGQAGIPASGAKAVVLTVTTVASPADGWTQLASNTDRPTAQTYNLYSGYNDTLSNTSIVTIGSDGKIALRTSVSQHYVIEVQGYFTSGDTVAPGGFVSVPNKRVVDSRDGTGVTAGAWNNDDVKTVNLKNVGGIPDTAGAVFANVIVVSADPNNLTPTLYPYRPDGTDPNAPLHYRGGETTGVGTTLDLNAEGDITFRVGWSTSPIHVIIDVQGYFDGQASDSTYHSLNTRLYDSRNTAVVPAGGTVQVQVAGVNGLPAAGPELAGVTMNITAINPSTSTDTGWFRVFPSDETEPPLSYVNYAEPGDKVSNVLIVRPGTTDGKINVKNMGVAPAHFLIDTQGWFTNAHLLPPATGPNGAVSGQRGAASMVNHTLSDTASVGWNPTTGNTVLTGSLLHLRGVGQDLNLGWRYNSYNDARPTLSLGRLEAALRVNSTTNAVTYTAPDGGWYTFASNGTTWTMPPGLNASLTKPNPNEYRIRFNDTGVTNVYTDDGANYSLARTIDANLTNPNTITYGHVNGVLNTITDTQGRVLKFLYEDTRNLNQPSKVTDTSLNRSVTLEYNGGQGRLSKITDATGTTTAFTYNTAGKLSTYTDGKTVKTSFTYDTAKRTATITYGTGTTAQSVWTPAYPSSTTTTLKDPNGKTATYTYNAAKQITKVLDANGNDVQSTFDGHDNRLTSTDGLGKTTTRAYNANNSLTKITSPLGGASGTAGEISFTYASLSGDPLSNYRPNAATNSEENTSTITYDANTSAVKQTASAGAVNEQTIIKNYYQGDTLGTTCGAKPGSLCKTIDGNGNTTTYSYNAAGNPVTITRPAPLGAVTNTFDAAGRVATVKDGKNQTATYTYDNNDRITEVRYGASCITSTCVAYTYDANGNLTQRVDAAGTTTYAYDAQNRATGKTIGGTTTTVTYDGASNILAFVDPTGTVTYKYDAANRLASLAEPGGSCPATPAFPNSTKCTGFGYDKNNRRISTSYPNGVTNTTGYDNTGKIMSITAKNSSGTVLTKRDYTYTTTPSGKEGGLRKTMATEVAGSLTTYGYDVQNRLTSATQGATVEGWTYDKNSNRISASKTGVATQYSTYNAADQLCWTATTNGACSTAPTAATSYSYDANGNTTAAGTTTSAFNVFNQVTSTTVGATTTNFAYAGLRNDERTSAGSTNFLNGSLGITTQTTAGATTAFLRDPDGGLVSMRTGTGASLYYTTDALGSVILLTDNTQAKTATYSYDSWGNTTATGTQAGANPWQYAGGYKDTPTGYTKFGARYYNPTTGRFTQPDPSDQEQNRYLYGGASRVANTDPTGLQYGDSGDPLPCSPANTATCAGFSPPLISSPADTFGCRLTAISWFFGPAALPRVGGLLFGEAANWAAGVIGISGFAGGGLCYGGL